MRPIERLLAALPEHKRGAGGQYSAKCPAHEDRQASLSFREGRDGRAVLKCHAGCQLGDIVASLGLKMQELFPDKIQSIEEARYRYEDENGKHLYDVVRFWPKSFRPQLPGASQWGLGDAGRVLFRLPQLRAGIGAGKDIWVVEGEKDVLALEARGFIATTNPFGSDSWKHGYGRAFHGAKRVVICPDQDEAGRKHCIAVQASLQGIVENVVVLHLPPPSKDVSDFFSAGGTKEQLESLSHNVDKEFPAAGNFGELESKMDPQKSIIPGALRAPGKGIIDFVPGGRGIPGNDSAGEFFLPFDKFRQAAEAEPELAWLIPQLVPTTGATLMVSAPNVGKTWLTIAAIKAALEAGRDVFLAEEEGMKRELLFRLQSIGLKDKDCGQLNIAHQTGALLTDDSFLGMLVGLASSTPAPLFVLDPITAFFLGDEDTENAKLMIHRMGFIKRANPRGLLICDHHTSKAGDSGMGSKVYSSRGSSVFPAWFDTQLNLHEVPKENGSIRFRVEVTKQRSFERAKPRMFELELGSGTMSIAEVDDGAGYEERILAALGRRKTPATKTEIVKAAKGKADRLFEALDILIDDGDVEMVGRNQFVLARGKKK